jgi:hypothetical protein
MKKAIEEGSTRTLGKGDGRQGSEKRAQGPGRPREAGEHNDIARPLQ